MLGGDGDGDGVGEREGWKGVIRGEGEGVMKRGYREVRGVVADVVCVVGEKVSWLCTFFFGGCLEGGWDAGEFCCEGVQCFGENRRRRMERRKNAVKVAVE